MPSPRDLINEVERYALLPDSTWERFSGYGIMGLPFSSGHILGLRCFPATSLGVPYISVWHRDADNHWVFYQNAPADKSCPRYFSNALMTIQRVDVIKVTWTGANDLSIFIGEDVGLQWDVTFSTTLSTRIMNMISRMIPSSLWQKQRFLNVMSVAASFMLGAGHLGLTGKVPNGQNFIANPRRIWMVRSSTAKIQGLDLGTPRRLVDQARLGDFWIPQQGIFAIGDSMFEPYNPEFHSIKAFQPEPD